MNIKLSTVEEILGNDIVKRGDWTEERKEILKDITWEEIDAETARLEAENPDKFKTPEEIIEQVRQLEIQFMAARRAETTDAEMVNA
jgi:hypothetical protein